MGVIRTKSHLEAQNGDLPALTLHGVCYNPCSIILATIVNHDVPGGAYHDTTIDEMWGKMLLVVLATAPPGTPYRLNQGGKGAPQRSQQVENQRVDG